MDASALITLWKPEFLRDVGDLWFEDFTHIVEDGWDNPVSPRREGGREFGRYAKGGTIAANRAGDPAHSQSKTLAGRASRASHL